MMGFMLFMCTITVMMYLSSLPPVQNSIITVKDVTSSDSNSKVDEKETNPEQEEVLEKLRNEVTDIIGEEENIEKYRYMLRLVHNLKENNILKSDITNTDNMPDFSQSNWKPPPKYWKKSTQKLYIKMHNITLKTVDLVLPFELLEETRESDIQKFVQAMEIYKIKYAKPKKPKEYKLRFYKKR